MRIALVMLDMSTAAADVSRPPARAAGSRQRPSQTIRLYTAEHVHALGQRWGFLDAALGHPGRT
jgi:hypothetical protein